MNESTTKPSYWTLLAEKIRQSPAAIQVARENIARWRSQGQSAPHRLDEWEALLAQAEVGEDGLRQLLSVLLGVDDRSARLRDFSPFPGVLTREERRRARELCGYRH